MVVRYVGLGKESSFGTEVSPVRFIDLARETLTQRHDWIVPELAAYRDARYALKGPIRVEGSLDMYVRADNIGEILMGLMGDVVTEQPDPENAPSVYNHTFKMADSLPSYTVRVASEVTARKFLGCVVRRVEFTCAPGEILGASVDFVGREEQPDTPGTPSWGEAPFFTFADCRVECPFDTPVNVRAFTLRIENDLVDDWYVLGDRRLAEIPVRGFTVEGSFDAMFTDRTHLDRFLNAEEFSLRIKFEGPEIEGGLRYLLMLEVPRCLPTAAGANVDRRELLVEGVEFRGVRDVGFAEGIVKISLQNKVSGY